MKSTYQIFPFILLLVFGLSQCRQDDGGPEEPTSVGTPYTLNVPSGFPNPNIPPDNPMTVEGVKLGRHLFYETALSGDNSMSCASCHIQERAFTDKTATSVGIDGISGTRKAMPLFNLAFADSLFWDGRVTTLEEQALLPIEDPIELHANLSDVISKLENISIYPPMFEAAFGTKNVTADRIAKAIAQFERTMISANSKFDRVERLFTGEQYTDQELIGKDMFFSEIGDCFHCHGSVESKYLMGAFGAEQLKNNGLYQVYTDEGLANITGKASDIGKFKVPSVRNIEFAFPFMHDGSIPNLDSLVNFYNFGGHLHANIDPNMKAAGQGRNWTEEQKNALIAFLRTMTDYDFLADTAFSNPH